MSLVRAALRLVTVEALRPSANLPDGPFPTLAGRHVYDSRIDPIEDLRLEERRPIAAVYTEQDNADPIAQSGARLYQSTVDLVIELSVAACEQVAAGIVTGVPESDADLEFWLDLFEAQIRWVLHFGPTGKMWRTLAILPAVDINSLPHRTSEEGVRLAMRTLRMKIKLRAVDEFDPAPATTPTGLARLPEPLKSVIASLPQDNYGVKIALGLADAMPVMPTAVPLKTVTLGGKATDPSGAIPAAPNVQGSANNLDQ